MFSRTCARAILASAVIALPACSRQEDAAKPDAGGSHAHYSAAGPDKPNADGQIAPRLQNLGAYTFQVSTKNEQAQKFINQGLNLSWAFNHAESGRAFREAARLDPNLAMAYWGQALVLGPNINAAMEPTDEGPAFEAIARAVSLKSSASEREAALIGALAARYSGKADDRVARDRAYSNAMRKVTERFPNDLDVQVLYVESVMDLRPWGYWTRDGNPYERTAEVVALTEKVIAKNPNHPGALHLYIHLIEAYQAMDVFVIASQSETQGLVLIEAMASGVPVVGIDACGVRDVIDDGSNGRLLARENEAQFAQALEWMMDLSDSGRKKMTREAIERAAEFSMKRLAEKALRIYGSLVWKESPLREDDDNAWAKAMRLAKAEWDLMKTLTRATTEAVR